MSNKKRIISVLLTIVMLISAFGFYNVFAESSQKSEGTAFSVGTPAAFEIKGTAKTKLSLKWSKAENAEGYLLQLEQSGKYVNIANTEKTSVTVTGLKSGNVHSFRLRAYARNGKKTVFSDRVYLKAATKPSAVTLKKSGSDNRQITVSWKKLSCTGYQIQYSSLSDFSKKTSKVISDNTVTSLTTKKLKASTDYYFRIRSYVKGAKATVYSEWTEFTVKTDKGYKTTPKGYKIETINGITYVDGVLIANKTYSIPQSYAPGGLTSECNAAFNQMRSAAAKDGINLYIVSGYRSYETQKNLYNRYVAKDGKALADTYSARPGTSEHQTGLAMDLNSVSGSFAQTREGKWLAANCYKYGFIIRYPYGKQSITGYIYEPWHVRYLGVDKATKIYQSGLCLEEYYGITSSYN